MELLLPENRDKTRDFSAPVNTSLKLERIQQWSEVLRAETEAEAHSNVGAGKVGAAEGQEGKGFQGGFEDSTVMYL